MLRCRENDLAIVLRGPYIGFMVTVGEFLGSAEARSLTTGEISRGQNQWAVHGIPEMRGWNQFLVEDNNLQPIRGRGTDQTTTTEKEMRA